MGKKKSRNKSSTRANPSSAQASCAKPAAMQADPGPSSECTWASLFKPKQTGVSKACAKPVACKPRPSAQEGSSVTNTTAATAPAQRLYAESQCRLKELLDNCYQWTGEQFRLASQNVLKILIGEIAELEFKGITRGPLTGENIFVIGTKVENLKVEILNTPREHNPGMPCYREQFRTLALEVVRSWDRPLATKHFFKMIEHCIPRFYFKQLEWHPLLLSSEEQAKLIIHAYMHLEIESEGWKDDYKKVIPRRNVDFRKTLGSAFGFCNVYKFKVDKYRTNPNPLGALMFYRNAHFHVNDHIYEHQKKNGVKPELIKDALLTTAQKENKLAHFFPEVPLELFNYMLIKEIDINAAI